MSKTIPTVVITKMEPRWRPFQVFILGLYELEHLGEIKLKFRCEWLFRLSTMMPDLPHIGGVFNQLAVHTRKESFLMEGYIEKDGIKYTFCIDRNDTPWCLDGDALRNRDIYFKMQCPISIDEKKGFRLAENVYIPYCDYKHVDEKIAIRAHGERIPLPDLGKYKHKVKPIIVGFRCLADGNSYKALKRGYEEYHKNTHIPAQKKLMCYFGDDEGHLPSVLSGPPDLDYGTDIMSLYPILDHPNHKRGIISKIIGKLGKGYDARLIRHHDLKTGKVETHSDLIVPIRDFCEHISQFEYNCNISGHKLSVPNRFSESFITGTGIVTDKLAIKWYLPFDEEVVELDEIGYLPLDSINWEKVENEIVSLPPVSKEKITALYEKKWAPIPVARYLVTTVLSSHDTGTEPVSNPS